MEELLESHYLFCRGSTLISEFQTRWRKKAKAILTLRPQNSERVKVALVLMLLLQTEGSKAIKMKKVKAS